MFADALGHFIAGTTLSILDCLSANTKRAKAKQRTTELSCLKAIEFILDFEPNTHGTPEDSREYLAHVELLKAHLHAEGILHLEYSWVDSTKILFKNLIDQERVNHLSVSRKWILSTILELLYTAFFGFSHYTLVLQESPVLALFRPLYQIPFFFAGLIFGASVSRWLTWMAKSQEEKEIKDTLQRLLKETDILPKILEYRPSETLTEGPSIAGIKLVAASLTRTGKKIKNVLSEAKDKVISLKDFAENRKQEQLSEKEARQKRFEDLTRGK